MKRILLVEDDPEIVMLFHVHIAGPEYVLSVCGSGQDAMDTAVQQYHDLIVLDHPLPDTTVGELCRLFTSQKVNSPILLLAANGGDAARTAAKCGAHDWLAKPFTLRQLRSKIKKLIRISDDNQMALASCD